MRKFLVAVALCACCTAWSQVMRTPSGPYELVYSFQPLGSPANSKDRGTYTMTESHGGLRIRCRSRSAQDELVFAGAKSLRKSGGGANSAIKEASCEDGFALGEFSMPLFMPFDFLAVKLYMPLGKFVELTRTLDLSRTPAGVKKAFLDVGNSNFSVRMTSVGIDPVRLEHRKVGGKEHASLRVGPPTLPIFKIEYSDFRAFAGASIPRKVVLTTFKKPAGDSVKTIKDAEFLFTLASAITSPKVPAIRIDGSLAAGDWISYQGSNGDAAGVIYDPREGPFEAQLQKQIQGGKLYPPDAEVPQSSPVWSKVPLALAAMFGAVAVYFLLKKSAPRAAGGSASIKAEEQAD